MAESSSIDLPDEAATARLGVALAGAVRAVAPPALVVFLEGELGAGKTTLVRALLAGLGHGGRVPSPTYTLVEPYALAGYRVFHVDLYRIADPGELQFLGLGDELGPGSLLLVEWPGRAAGGIPAPDLEVALAVAESGRRARLVGFSAAGKALLGHLAGGAAAS